MKKFTFEEVTAQIREIINEYGEDYVYPKRDDATPWEENACEYVREGESSCLVGKWLDKIGVPIETIVKLDTLNYGTGVGIAQYFEGVVLGNQQNILGVEVDMDTRNFLGRLQYSQDHGETWGKSYENAISSSNR